MGIQKTVLISIPIILTHVAASFVNNNESKDTIQCGKGTYISNASGMEAECAACPEGMYMDEKNHSYLSCKRCTDYSVDPNVQTIVPCTADRNTVIEKCKDGFYIDHRPNENECKPCPVCAMARTDQQECCPNTRITSTTRPHTASTPSPNTDSYGTKQNYDFVTESTNVTHQHPSIVSDSQLSVGTIVGIGAACCFVIITCIVIGLILYKKFYIDRKRKNRRSLTLCDFIKELCQKRPNENNDPITMLVLQ